MTITSRYASFRTVKVWRICDRRYGFGTKRGESGLPHLLSGILILWKLIPISTQPAVSSPIVAPNAEWAFLPFLTPIAIVGA